MHGVTPLQKALSISRGEPHVVAALGNLEHDGGALEKLAELALTREVSSVHFATGSAGSCNRISA